MVKNKLPLGVFVCMGLALLGVVLKSVSGSSDLAWIEVFKSILYMWGYSSICLVIYNALVKKIVSNISKIQVRYLMSIVSIVAVGYLIYPYYYLFYFITTLDKGSWISSESNWYSVMLARGVTISALMFFVVYYLQLLQDKQKRILEIEQLKQAQLEANLSNLKEQLNPHFLFNSLNTLSSLTEEEVVKDYVSELADVYRYMLAHNKMSTVTVEMELKFVRSYLYIMKTRMGENICIDLHLDENIKKIKIPPLTLQILLENAIKHNIASREHPLYIKMYNVGLDYLIIENNYNPKIQMQSSTGIGLGNLAKRYHLLFGNEIQIIHSADSFTVKLPLPQL
ncbi:sensor histidine kinase [Rhizosphaericola mali]|uniref:Signal transduction histidine kinase internal region domain-containing protein n=1 Tax=Rhizosphaericola mali TaxID=2545455 RepID=A0A5P2FYG8_9BACT|nr:histidine kinase [Rhizosphaericola mali]QES88584.1 hypothetical protein E0W69_007890 [Rhizosphaericola mali]